MIDAREQEELLTQEIQKLIEHSGTEPGSFDGKLVAQMIETSLRLLSDRHDTGQLKLINRSLKEMRYAYKIFNKYSNSRRISIFGSARTPEDHPDYLAAKAFSAEMAKFGWMVITGAANGIMKAGLEGPELEGCFGLSIRLPFEIPTNSIIAGDPKLITFNYFFTRKLMFLSQSQALAAFPGGFGTLDELFEVLTLMQTGKSDIRPVVLLEGKNGVYWQHWENYVQKHLLKNGWISEEDLSLYYMAPDIESALHHIQKFYYRYHSSRYVKDLLVLRLITPLTQAQLEDLNEHFSSLASEGHIVQTTALPEETDHLSLPRLVFNHHRKNYGKLRMMIDRINSY